MNENIGYSHFNMFQGNTCINIQVYLINDRIIIM